MASSASRTASPVRLRGSSGRMGRIGGGLIAKIPACPCISLPGEVVVQSARRCVHRPEITQFPVIELGDD
jgi:hypothetical protein